MTTIQPLDQTVDLETDASTIQALFDAQAATALALRASQPAERRAKIVRLRDAILARRERWYAAFHTDLRKPAVEVELTELLPVVDEAHLALKKLAKWMKPRRVLPTLTTLGTTARVLYQPRGRCLIVGPWNYPLNTVLGPLVSAVAAGNAIIIKPSEFTPNVNRVIDEVVREAFDPAEVTLIHGGAATAERLLALPFDHVFFTGSPAIGKLVMAAAAKHLGSVTLELGGKSPAIVDASANVEAAVELLVWGKFTNAGQTCVAPDHLYVHRSVAARFVEHWRKVVATRFGQTPEVVVSSPDLGRMISVRHARRVVDLLEDARALGARVIDGGQHDCERRYVAPTLISEVPEKARIESEEIFGPLMPLRLFDDLDEVIQRINAAPKPLALYVWSSTREHIDSIVARTSSGGLCLNHCMQQYAHSGLPFGGINHSGIGSAHGHYGFKAFSHERAFLQAAPVMTLKLFFPPYSKRKLALSRWLVDWLGRSR
jgi:aldehyde dehydrogenase (NAD+)